MPLTEILNHSQNYQGKLIFFLERREVKYSVGLFGFLERDNLSTVSSSPLLPLPPTSASSTMSDGELSANLVVEVVPLLTSASSAMSDGEFPADLVVVVLSIEVSGPANLLKP